MTPSMLDIYQNHLLNIRACKVFLRSAEAASLQDAEVQAVLAALPGGGPPSSVAAAPAAHPWVGPPIKRQRNASGGGKGVGLYGSVGQRAIQQTSQEILEAEAKLQALQDRCWELEEDNALMTAKEAVYLPYTQG